MRNYDWERKKKSINYLFAFLYKSIIFGLSGHCFIWNIFFYDEDDEKDEEDDDNGDIDENDDIYDCGDNGDGDNDHIVRILIILIYSDDINNSQWCFLSLSVGPSHL